MYFHLCLIITTLATTSSDDSRRILSNKPRPKFNLVVVIGGFRWDHIKRFTNIRKGKRFPGFEQFLAGGVQTEYLTSVFPSESFPAWQTINTGLYPGTHNIIADQFVDNEEKNYFDKSNEQSTGQLKWWAENKPIWASASQAGLNFSTMSWSRCDIPWNDVETHRPQFCENVYRIDPSKHFPFLTDFALQQYQTKRTAAAIAYDDSLLQASIKYGPLSIEVETKLHALDEHVERLLNQLKTTTMDTMVNVIIMSDHGMTYGKNPALNHHHPNFEFDRHVVHRISLEQSIGVRQMNRHVRFVIGDGAYAMIYPKLGRQNINKVVEKLQSSLNGRAQVFKKDDIPEHLHWKDSKYCPPILVLARPGVVIDQVSSQYRKPSLISTSSYDIYNGGPSKPGISGYDPEEPDMRGVFMARGPDFISSSTPQPAIELVDVYQMLCFLLDIDSPEPNDGVWSRIRNLLKNSSVTVNSSVVLILASVIVTYTYH